MSVNLALKGGRKSAWAEALLPPTAIEGVKESLNEPMYLHEIVCFSQLEKPWEMWGIALRKAQPLSPCLMCRTSPCLLFADVFVPDLGVGADIFGQ